MNNLLRTTGCNKAMLLLVAAICLALPNYLQAQTDIYLKPRAVDSVKRNRARHNIFSVPQNGPFKIYLINRYQYNNSQIIPDQTVRNSKYESIGSLGTTLGTYIETPWQVGLQIEVGMCEKNSGISNLQFYPPKDSIRYDGVYHYSQQYLHIPILLRLNPIGNSDQLASLYILAGADINYLLNATIKQQIYLRGVPYGNYYEDITKEMSRTEVAITAGIGGHAQLTNTFGLFAEARLGTGITEFVMAGFISPPRAHLNYWQLAGGISYKLY